MMDKPVKEMGRLVIAFGTSEQWVVFAWMDDAKRQYEELRELLQAVDGIGAKFYEFEGFQEADRSPECFLVRVDDVKGVCMQRRISLEE